MEKLKIEREKPPSLLDSLLKSEGLQRQKIAEKIFSKIARMLIAKELQLKIVPMEQFLKISGATEEQDAEDNAVEGACGFLEPAEEGVWKIYIPEEYAADERSKAFLHEALHALFDPRELEEDDREREIVERIGHHAKIYEAEDILWNALSEKSKRWLVGFGKKSKKLPFQS
jgi:hypothetical protein